MQTNRKSFQSMLVLATCAATAIAITGVSASANTQGLTSTVWHLTGAQFGSANVDGGGTSQDLTNVEANLVNNGLGGVTPSYSFINTKDSFTYLGGGVPTNTFLGADAAGAALTDTTPWTNSIIDQIGFITVSQTGNYTFALPPFGNSNDDATRVYLNGTGTPGTGTMVVQNNFSNDLTPTSTVESLTAGTAYAFEILNYQEGGGAAMNFSVTGPTGSTVAYSTVPEPTTLAILGLGALGLMFGFRRKTA